MNHYVIEAVLKEKKQDMLQEAQRLRRVREYEEHLQSSGPDKDKLFVLRLLGHLELALGNQLIRTGVWLTRRHMRRGCSLTCEG